MKSLNLSNVTLIAVITDEKYIPQILTANKICCTNIEFGQNILICPPPKKDIDGAVLLEKIANYNITAHFEKVEWANFSPWILANFNRFVETSHCLVYQCDGYIIDHTKWTDDFLSCDYIGAVWPDVGQANRVGNGGFSLRSKKLLELSTKIHPDPNSKHKAEDWTICVDNFNYMIQNGINFADIHTARKFSVEHTNDVCSYNKNKLETYNSFGFHDKTNIAAMKAINERLINNL